MVSMTNNKQESKVTVFEFQTRIVGSEPISSAVVHTMFSTRIIDCMRPRLSPVLIPATCWPVCKLHMLILPSAPPLHTCGVPQLFRERKIQDSTVSSTRSKHWTAEGKICLFVQLTVWLNSKTRSCNPFSSSSCFFLSCSCFIRNFFILYQYFIAFIS